MFILKTITGQEIKITEQEYKNILMAKTDVITLSNGITIRKNVIAIIYPESRADEIENSTQPQTGVLHDGTRVIRRFGEWFVANEVYPDDDGREQHIRLDPEYYPEVASDNIATEEEWKQIMEGKNYYEITGYKPPVKRISINGLTPMFN